MFALGQFGYLGNKDDLGSAWRCTTKKILCRGWGFSKAVKRDFVVEDRDTVLKQGQREEDEEKKEEAWRDKYLYLPLANAATMLEASSCRAT